MTYSSAAEELGYQRVGEGEEFSLGGGEGVGGGVHGADQGCADGRDGGGGEVAGNDFAVGIGGLPGLGEFAGEVARDRGFAEGAGVEVQKGGHWVNLLYNN